MEQRKHFDNPNCNWKQGTTTLVTLVYEILRNKTAISILLVKHLLPLQMKKKKFEKFHFFKNLFVKIFKNFFNKFFILKYKIFKQVNLFRNLKLNKGKVQQVFSFGHLNIGVKCAT